MSTSTRVAALSDIEPDSALRVEVDGVGPISVVRIGDDVYAIGDICTHQNVSLSEGEVDPDEKTVECWKHGSAFSLETGEPSSLPATKPEPVFEAKVIDGDVYLEIP